MPEHDDDCPDENPPSDPGPVPPPVPVAAVDVAEEEVVVVDVGLEPDESPRETPTLARIVGIKRIAAWTGSSSLGSEAAMDRDVAFCRATGISEIHLMVNDFSVSRDPRPFSTYATARIIEFAQKLRDAEIDLVLTSWIMPHHGFLLGAAQQLLDLVEKTRARAIEWDAEEPWTQARQPLDYVLAAELVRDAFGPIRMGVTGIGYAPVDKFGPLAEVCDYVVPQIYTTATSNIDPDTDIGLFAQRYRDLFGPKNTVVGLAAYGQVGVPGHTIESAIRTAYKQTNALGYVKQVCYWSLMAIRKSPTVTNTIKALAGAGMPPTVTITGSVGQGGTNRPDDVRVVQQLLLEHGYDVGVVDGIVGPRTIAAIRAFQSTFMARPDGRVDPGGATFKALIGG